MQQLGNNKAENSARNHEKYLKYHRIKRQNRTKLSNIRDATKRNNKAEKSARNHEKTFLSSNKKEKKQNTKRQLLQEKWWSLTEATNFSQRWHPRKATSFHGQGVGESHRSVQ